jgi:hypothetical protein
MSRIRFLVISGLLMFSACEQSEVISPTNSAPPAEIYGSIMNWEFGDTMAIDATAGVSYVFARGSVRHDGTFYLSLPQPPRTILSRPMSPYDTLSDTGATTLFLNGLLLSNPDQTKQYWIINERRASPQTYSPGDFSIVYIYSDRQVWWRRTEIIGSSDTVGAIFDLHLNNGWNRVTVRHEVDRPHASILIFRVENVQVQSWRIVGEL